jgi:hypothetical protein
MKKLLLFLITLMYVPSMDAQVDSAKTGRIEGYITKTGTDIKLGAVHILAIDSNSILDWQVSDSCGYYLLDSLPISTFTLVFMDGGSNDSVIKRIATFNGLTTLYDMQLDMNKTYHRCRGVRSVTITTCGPSENHELQSLNDSSSKLYPNPTHGKFTLELSDDIEQVSIFNMQGKGLWFKNRK